MTSTLRSALRAALGVALACIAPHGIAAQVVTGTVVLVDSTTPVSGAIVLAIDAQGMTAGRGLTTARGSFTVRLNAPGTVELRVLRIGFKPLKGPSLTVAAGALQKVQIVYAAEAVSLAAVNVRERETCRVQNDSGLMVASLWEEARKAMLTSQLSSDEAPLFAEWIEYDRTLDSTSRIIRRQNIHTSRNPTTHAFRSVPANVLKTSGYVVEIDGETTYYAPDADVLLSDAFVTSHCFRIVAPPKTDDQRRIGVAFVPTRDRGTMKEIEGTLWIDRPTAELRSLDFRYTNLPDAASAARPGGSVEFLRLLDGNWLVSRWTLRMPELTSRSVSTSSNSKIVVKGNRMALHGVQVRGGEVVRATRRDSLLYEEKGAHVAVKVLARSPLVPAVEVRIELEGTDYTSVADDAGDIRLSPILPGRYVANVHTALMDSIGLPAVTREIETRMDSHVDSLFLPTPAELLGRACPADSTRNGAGMLHGWAKDARSQVLAHAAVTVHWRKEAPVTLGTLTDDAGYWRVCGIPQATSVSVRVVSDSGADLREARLDGVPFAEVGLVLHSVASAESGAGVRALVELAIADTHGAPLQNTTLEVLPVGGTPVIAVTGAGGKALVPDLAPGVISVRARHLGFVEGFVTATVRGGRNTVPIVMSTVSTPLLDTMRVVGDRVMKGRLGEFEQRRLDKTATAVFTREDIVKRNPTEAFQMLSNLSTVKVTEGFTAGRSGDEVVAAVSTRTYSPNLINGSQPCFYMVMVDGVVKRPPAGQQSFDLRQLPRPEEIHGIEVFAGPASIPLQYGGVGDGKWCGLIAVWTR